MFWFKKAYKKTGKRQYSWHPDLPDGRDFSFKLEAPGVTLPSKADLRSLCPPVQDQGDLGSCTAHALTGAVEVLETIDKLPVTMMSRLFVYFNERVIEHTVNQDAGAQLRDGIKALAQWGVCHETDWPYNPPAFTKNPNCLAFKNAAQHKITSYQRLVTLSDLKACLAAGFPFVFGFTVYESFESPDVAKTGVVPLPGPDERCLGGHAVLGVGYDDFTSCFIVRNSWGPSWGQQGYFMIPYTYLANQNLATDFWTIRRGNFMLKRPS